MATVPSVAWAGFSPKPLISFVSGQDDRARAAALRGRDGSQFGSDSAGASAR
jgi:hypothetical protein